MGNNFSKPIVEDGGGPEQRRNNANNRMQQQQPGIYNNANRNNTAQQGFAAVQAYHDRSPTGRGGRHGQKNKSSK